MVKRSLYGALAVFALLVPGASSARAQDDGCTTRLLMCYERAARVENFWYRWAAGLDCELNYTSCVRQKLLGY